MKLHNIVLAISILFSISLVHCSYEKDPGIVTYNGSVKGTVVDMLTTDNPIEGAKIKIWFNDNSTDYIFKYTDENGYYETEKLNINSGNIINIEASKKPDYEVTTTKFNGIDFNTSNTPGEITGGENYPSLIVDFGLSPIVIRYQIIPDTLYYQIKYDEVDPEVLYKQINILNKGRTALSWTINTQWDWIFPDPETASGLVPEKEFAYLNIGVVRAELSPGNNLGSVEISISDSVTVIPVYVSAY